MTRGEPRSSKISSDDTRWTNTLFNGKFSETRTSPTIRSLFQVPMAAVIFNPILRGSTRPDKNTRSLSDFPMNEVQQAVKSIDRLPFGRWWTSMELVDSNHLFPLSSSIQFYERRQGYCLPLWLSHTPSAAGKQTVKSISLMIRYI